MSEKGGVGKTTVAANLAFVLGMKGLYVGLMDADIHCPNVPKILWIEEKQRPANRRNNLSCSSYTACEGDFYRIFASEQGHFGYLARTDEDGCDKTIPF